MRSSIGRGRTIILEGISAMLLLAVPAAAQSPRILEQSGNWAAFEAAGWLGYGGNAEDGSRLEITCDVAHSLTPGPGGISVTIAGHQPGAGAEVRLSTTAQSITATTAEQAGWIAGRNCPGCEETFRVLWSMLRSGDELVMEAEGRRATLPLDGTAAVMPPDGCPVDGETSLGTPSGAAPTSDGAGEPPGRTSQGAAWTASGRDGMAGTLGVSSDGVRLNVGCNFRLGPGARATVHDYSGDVLQRIDDQTEPISLEVVRRDGSRRLFRAGMHYFAPDDGHIVGDHLPVAFLEAFATGDRLILRNGAGVAAAEWELTGTAAAVRTMRGICRF